MNYRYRVKGIAEKAFILRGRYFRVGAEVESYILDSEMEFIKDHCKLTDVLDINATAQSSKPLPNNQKTMPKGEKNDLAKPTSRASKGRNQEKV